MSTEAVFVLLVCAILVAIAVMASVGYMIACKLDQPNSGGGQVKSRAQLKT